MPALSVAQTFEEGDSFAFSNASVLLPVVSDDQDWLLVGANASGVLSSLRLDEDGPATLATQGARATGGGFVSGLVTEIGGTDFLITFDTFARAPRIQDISDPAAPGEMAALEMVSGGLAGITRMIEVSTTAGDYLVGTGFGGHGLGSYALTAGGRALPRLSQVDSLPSSAKSDDRGITELGDLRVAGTDFVLSLTPGTLNSFRMALDGSLTQVDSIAAHEGLWTSGMGAMATLEVEGTSFVVVAGWESDSLSTVRINPMGVFFPADLLRDDLSTRFGGASAIETFEHRGRDFVLAAGDDQGVALLEVLPDGTLIHHHSLVHDAAWDLGPVQALAVSVTGETAQIFVTGTAHGGLARLTLDLDSIGARQTGGRGADTLEGGAGADVFAFEADGQADRINGFEHGIDRIDLSGWGWIGGMDDLRLIGTGLGAVIRWQDEEVRVIADDRSWIGPGDWTADDFIF